MMRSRPIRLRSVLPLLMPVLLVGGTLSCGDGGEEAAPETAEEAPVRPEDIRSDGGVEALSDDSTEGADPSAGTAGESSGSPAGTVRSEPLYTVQLGAFALEGNASTVRERIEAAGLPVWTPTTRAGSRDLTRVRVGATGSVADARRLVGRIRATWDGELWIAPIEPGEELPDRIAEATRAALAGG